ncbi:MAG: HNH endonuclease [Deltaproteobacteria bacterium]|nr:HNH endonuclease [Deltaproteobacteria bacterium]
MGLYLVPGTRANLERTIERPLDDPHALALIEPIVLEELGRRSGLEGLRLWAMTRPRQAAFDAMQPGDDVLITEKGTGRFTHYGQVIGKIENPRLGELVWPVVGENPWELIYFVRNVRRIDVPKATLLTALGYAANDAVAGSRRAKEDGLAQFVSRHGAIAEWLGVEAGTADLCPASAHPEQDFTGSDLLAASKRRVGQQLFAQRVKANYRGACALCGVTEDRFLVAGHIVGWAEDRLNRLNPANGICLCVLHDRAFEAGYLALDPQLRVLVAPRLDPASPLGRLLCPLAGQALSLPLEAPPGEAFLARHRARLLP